VSTESRAAHGPYASAAGSRSRARDWASALRGIATLANEAAEALELHLGEDTP
jgi:hypothetical protein